jgi:hypothetical protein
MANYFDKFDPPSPAQTPLPNGANPFDQFDPPSNDRTFAGRGGKAMSPAAAALEALFRESDPRGQSGAQSATPQSDAARQLEALFSNVPSSGGAEGRATSGNPYLDMLPQGGAGMATHPWSGGTHISICFRLAGHPCAP